MRPKLVIGLMLALLLVLGAFILTKRYSTSPAEGLEPQPLENASSPASIPPLRELTQSAANTSPAFTPEVAAPTSHAQRPAQATFVTNKLARLAQIQAVFKSLAAGNPKDALHGAKELTDETEREIALLALVTEWTRGELRSPRERAQSIADYGLEAGWGMELAKNPELALLWANELTDGAGRIALLAATANALVKSDPASAFALRDQIPESSQREFLDLLFAGWASQDTDAALQFADQLSDAAEKEANLKAIRTTAPVGIGAALRMQEGLPVINQLMPGTPSELSGQLYPGDRIIALAQGDGVFQQTRGLPLQNIVQLIRGEPGTLLKLQVLSADAPANSLPRTVPIVRSQLKFKQ